MIILVGGEKGGSGKSCLAQNLATYFRVEKNANVLMIDCDPQQTTTDWINARSANPALPNIECKYLQGKIRNELLSLRQYHDYVIIDCGGYDNMALRSSIAVANHILIPMRPNRRDIKTIPRMEDIISTCKMGNPNMNVAIVMAQCPSLPNMADRIESAKKVCDSFNLPVLDSVTYNRNIYDDSEEFGSSVLESDPKGKAANEIRSVIEELLGSDHNCSNEPPVANKVHALA